jgi:hypothetical protein
MIFFSTFSALSSLADIPKDVLRQISRMKSSEIKWLVTFGIGIHHAGLHRVDRNIIGLISRLMIYIYMVKLVKFRGVVSYRISSSSGMHCHACVGY